MEEGVLLAFGVLSVALNVIMESVKKIKVVGQNKWFKYFAPIIPLVIGGISGPLIVEEFLPNFSVYTYVLGGIIAGAVSTTVYEIFEKMLIRKSEE